MYGSGVSPPYYQASNAPTPAGYPILFSSDTIYMEIASEPTSEELSPTWLFPHPLDAKHKPRL